MTTRTAIAAGVGAAVLAAGGFAVASSQDIIPLSATATTTTVLSEKGCNDWPGAFTDAECGAAGFTLTALQNIQPAIQFCKWKAANPGEWNRLSAYSSSGTPAQSIITWLGGSINNSLAAYFVTGAPPFTLQITLPPNACGGKLIKPPIISGVTPGETDVTVTVTTTP